MLCKRGLKYFIIPCRVIHLRLKLLASYTHTVYQFVIFFLFDYGHVFKYIYNKKNFKKWIQCTWDTSNSTQLAAY